MSIKILIIEDEISISNIEKQYLELEGYNVIQSFDGEDGLNKFKLENPDLVILDLMLPKISGEDIMSYIKNYSETPVVMVTAKIEEENRINGLKLGADDYIIKPFSAKELVLRVKNILRRSRKHDIPKADLITSNTGELVLDLENNNLYKNGSLISLTNNEFKIVKTLFSYPKKIFTREEIIEVGFGVDYTAFDRAIDTHIKNIRSKLENNPKDPNYILTVYGIGYKANI
ncbi:response regulator transcription factor [Miniphocaeibacter massiliensis]|uniref:response regulator transcription factor n=1 Tax=Miniphocaeibacter massiliensis TaxID=2041841 RepID=UPI000C0798FE|nr:response regulator transcription factor [Miniphocaeibacter massiliensis]